MALVILGPKQLWKSRVGIWLRPELGYNESSIGFRKVNRVER